MLRASTDADRQDDRHDVGKETPKGNQECRAKPDEGVSIMTSALAPEALVLPRSSKRNRMSQGTMND